MTLHKDPWESISGAKSVDCAQPELGFQDNFIPPVSDRLPDSEQYLAILEEKLRKIKDDPDIFKQLAEKREACMQNLLNSDTQFEDNSLDEPLESSQILRVINHKQALTKEMALKIDFTKRALVFITGASKGIGRSIAREISHVVSHNSVIVLLARDEKALDETKSLIQEVDKALTVFTYPVDLAKADKKFYEDVVENVKKSVDTNGIELGVIFHNAGSTGEVKQTLDLSDVEVWRSYYDLNLFSVAVFNSVIIPKIRPIAPQLVVANITSLCGRSPFKDLGMYGSGKAARELLFKVLAIEEPNIVVLNYSPGPVDTDMFSGIIDNAQSEEVRQSFQKVKETNIVTPVQTVGKLLAILEKGEFKSGDTLDYFDVV